MNNYLLVFSNCFITKGASRSIIFDYQREDVYFIENTHYDFLMQCKLKPLEEVTREFRPLIPEDDLSAFIAFCEENELVFQTDTPHYFPETAIQFDHPSLITNAIIDINASSDHNYPQIFEELQTVACKDVQMRFYDAISLQELEEIISYFKLNQHGQSLELVIKMTDEYNDDRLIELTHKYIFIKSIIVHSSERNELFKIHSHALRAGMGNIIFTSQQIDSGTHCGNISSSGFNYNNIAAYMEARLFNSCLNRKVGIDVDGRIKNCPSQEQHFGKIGETPLLYICLEEQFQHLWNIKKDDVAVCRDCEFRYICSDCRIFTENMADQYSKPMKCNYDPYTNNWS